MKPVVTVSYKSNVAKVSADVHRQVAEFLERAAQDGAAVMRARSDPHVRTTVTKVEDTKGLVRVGVFIPRDEFWATMFDKGTLSERKVPLKQPGRRRMEWKVKRRGKNGRPVEFTAHRHGEALASGGIRPEYFIIRGKRTAEQRRDEYLTAWLKAQPPATPPTAPTTPPAA